MIKTITTKINDGDDINITIINTTVLISVSILTTVFIALKAMHGSGSNH